MTLPGRMWFSANAPDAVAFQALTPFVRLANAEGTALVDSAVGRGQTDKAGLFTLNIDRAVLEGHLAPMELLPTPPGCRGGRQLSGAGALTSYPLLVDMTAPQTAPGQTHTLLAFTLETGSSSAAEYVLEYVRGQARVTADEVCVHTQGGTTETTTVRADIDYTPGWNVVEKRFEAVLPGNNGGDSAITVTYRKVPLPDHFALYPTGATPGFQSQSNQADLRLLRGW